MTPAWMLGLTSWRGMAIPTIDLTHYVFGEAQTREQRAGASPIFFVAQHNDTYLAFFITSTVTITILDLQYLHPSRSASSGITTEHLPIVQSIYRHENLEAWLLDMKNIFTAIVQQIEISTL